ncbi:hypothetical protein CLOP_g21908, partial [Closterium sp. NIES-67]
LSPSFARLASSTAAGSNGDGSRDGNSSNASRSISDSTSTSSDSSSDSSARSGSGSSGGESASWIERYLPAPVQPFAHLARLDKPTGTWLLAWPCFWSIALAAPAGALPDPLLLFLFGSGAVLLRGAGCTINDLLDQDFDAKVARTRTRPLPAGAVTPLGASSFLGLQLLLGLGILVQLNTYSQVLGAASLPLVFSYPLTKRFTHWPQAYLGLVFNWGALLGWAAVHGSLNLPAVLPLYAGGICWTLVYDTIYAHQDKADDITAGVKSTALLFAHRTPLYLSLFGAASIASLAAAGSAVNLGSPYYVALAAAGAHMAWQIASTNYDNREDCYSKFASNWTFGALVFAGIVAGKLFGV